MKNYLKEANDVFPLAGTIALSIIIALVLCFIDFFRPLYKFMDGCPQGLLVFLGVGIVVIILCLLFYIHFWALFKMPCANIADTILCILFLVSILYLLVTVLVDETYRGKHILTTVFLVVWFLLSVCRIIIVSRKSNVRVSQSNVFDLREIYEDNFNVDKDMPILITEKDVDYDLLNRSALIDQLYKTICSCPTDSPYVVGLEGEWGSGKTTIINNVKRIIRDNENTIVVKDFDPWVFGTQEALLLAVYDIVLESAGIKYSRSQSRRMLRYITATVTNGLLSGNSLQHEIPRKIDSYKEVEQIKSDLSLLLQKTNTTYVFFIDNIDRAEADNILFLFKLIGTLFDLPGIVYVLSYDRDRINNIFSDSKKINPKYLEKIIQIELKVPAIQRDSLENIYGQCVSNVIKKYGVPSEDLHEYKSILTVICDNVLELRKFKRLINSTFPITFIENKILDKKDLLAVEVIRFLKPELYFEIRNNPKFFVSHDPMSNIDIYSTRLDKNRFNQEGKDFFDELFDEYPEFLKFLADLFPFVKRYQHHQALITDYQTGDSEYAYISKKASICSAKYFDLYFSYGNNDYLSIKATVEMTVEEIQNAQSKEQLNNTIYCVFSALPENKHREWLEQFQYYIDELPQESIYEIVIALFNCIYDISPSDTFMVLNARRRAEVIIELLLEVASLDDVQRFAQVVTDQYDKLVVINGILYWFEHTHTNEEFKKIQEKEKVIRGVYSQMCKNIVERPINLYEDSYYCRKNIWGLFRYYNDDEKKDSLLKDYMSGCVSKETVYRVLGDAIVIAIGRQFEYSITENSLETLYLNEETIDRLLIQHKPETESEKFVLKVYKKYKTHEVDVFDHCSIYTSNEVELHL